MSNRTCECGAGPCICAELDRFEREAESVTTSVSMKNEMFDLCTGTSLASGERIVNLVIRNPHSGEEGILSFHKAEALRLINLLIQGYDINWPDEIED